MTRSRMGKDDRSIVRPMLKQMPLGFEQVREMFAGVSIQPTAKRQVMCALDVVD